MAGQSPARFSDLGTRTLSAIVLVSVALLAGWLGGYAWAGLVAIAAGIMAWEFFRMVAPPKDRPDAGLAISVITAGASVIVTHAMGLIIGMVAPIAGVLMLGATDPKRYARVALGIYYISLASVGLVALRDQPEQGMWLVLWLVLIVIASDIGGYFAGRLFGGAKLWPRVSPNKTWSGTIGGWVLALIVTFPYALWMDWNLYNSLFLAVLLAMASQAGDLAESAVKRAAGVKDASNLIPGHGGFLDRFDALMGASILATIIGISGYLQ